MCRGPFFPKDGWETLSRSHVKHLLEAEWYLWIADMVDNIEKEANMEEFKADGSKYNPYRRDKVLDDACTQASGTRSPGTPISESFAQNSFERPVGVSH